MTPLAKFEMGTVVTSFLANADGSFALDFMLASVQMEDLIAVGSVFPLILRRLEPSLSRRSQAFQFRLKKSKNRDSDVWLHMVAVELVSTLRNAFVITARSFH